VSEPITRPRILVVDDDALVLKAVVRLLCALGADAVPALGGRTALVVLESMDPPPDLILTDVRMPGLDGEELLRRVRADETFGTIPVIAMTGTGTDQPFDLVLPKPFRDGDLRDALRLADRSAELPERLVMAARRLLRSLDERPGPARRVQAAAAAELVLGVLDALDRGQAVTPGTPRRR
jgi:CheY-like chemotaxis protein